MLEILEEKLRFERERRELSPIDDSFFQDVFEYLEALRTKRDELKKTSKNNLFDSKTQKALYRIYEKLIKISEREIQELIDLRVSKILEGRRENLLEQEKKVLKESTRVEKLKRELYLSLLSPKPLVKVEIISEIPEFVGPDMNTYGPYHPGEKIELSHALAKLLSGHGLCKVMKR
ncbi:MAG: hypothetical protein ACE5K0_08165 [Candidatus Methanofastidiosia archaeon]